MHRKWLHTCEIFVCVYIYGLCSFTDWHFFAVDDTDRLVRFNERELILNNTSLTKFFDD